MKKLLTIADLNPLMMNAMNFLHRSEIEVVTGATNDELLKSHIMAGASLIVTRLDAPGLACETLVHTIRRSENMRKVSIALLCDDERSQRERCSRSGANAVITRPVDTALLAEVVQKLLDIAPRRHYRVVLNAVVDGRHGNRPFVCSSLDVSANGMLLRTPEPLDQGEHIACSFYLPNGTRVSASGEVVRKADRSAASDAYHYGVRFVTIAPEAEKAIAQFVEKELERRSASASAPVTAASPSL